MSSNYIVFVWFVFFLFGVCVHSVLDICLVEKIFTEFRLSFLQLSFMCKCVKKNHSSTKLGKPTTLLSSFCFWTDSTNLFPLNRFGIRKSKTIFEPCLKKNQRFYIEKVGKNEWNCKIKRSLHGDTIIYWCVVRKFACMRACVHAFLCVTVRAYICFIKKEMFNVINSKHRQTTQPFTTNSMTISS